MNGDYGEWSSWSICSKTCGRGWKKRIRACNDPLPSNGGKDCYELGLGPTEERTHCFERSCPREYFPAVVLVFYVYTEWIDLCGKNTVIFIFLGVEKQCISHFLEPVKKYKEADDICSIFVSNRVNLM